MNKIFKIFFFATLGLLLFSCEKDDEMLMISNPSESKLSADKTSLVLVKADAAQNVISFSWQNPNYGQNVVVKNELQFAVKGTNFAAPKSADLDATAKSKTYKTEEFNALMLNLGLNPGQAANIEARLKSQVGNTTPVYSANLQLNITAYALISYMYAPGAYQGWDPATANTLVSANSNGIFIGYINFPAAGSEFKVTQDKNWNVNYGGSGGNLSSTGANIQSPGAGYHKLTVDMNTMKYTLVPYQLSIIGAATVGGWNTDTDMSWDNSLLKWKVVSNFTSGEMKFRLNHDWGTNWGDDGANGTLDAGGANINISAGSHTILFNPFDLTYTIN